MTYAGTFGLPTSGAQIIVRTDEMELRKATYTYDAHRAAVANEDTKVRSLLSEVVALRKAGRK